MCAFFSKKNDKLEKIGYNEKKVNIKILGTKCILTNSEANICLYITL